MGEEPIRYALRKEEGEGLEYEDIQEK